MADTVRYVSVRSGLGRRDALAGTDGVPCARGLHALMPVPLSDAREDIGYLANARTAPAAATHGGDAVSGDEERPERGSRGPGQAPRGPVAVGTRRLVGRLESWLSHGACGAPRSAACN